MIKAFVGAGGKTSAIFEQARQYCWEGNKVLICTSTHMYLEKDTLVDATSEQIISELYKCGVVMAGSRASEDKMGPLPYEIYLEVCAHADIVLIEADGSRHMPIKYPGDHEPVIYPNVDTVTIVMGMSAVGKPAGRVCQRVELSGINPRTIITEDHIEELIRVYARKIDRLYPGKQILVKRVPDETKIRKKKRKRAWIIGLLLLLILGYAGFRYAEYRKEVREKITAYKEKMQVEIEQKTEKPEKDADLKHFYYQALNPDGKKIYTAILEGVKNRRGNIAFEDSYALEDLKMAFPAVFYDHPEIFWVDVTSYSYISAGKNGNAIGLRPQYICTVEEQKKQQKTIDAILADLKKETKGLDDYSRLVKVYRYLIDHVEYEKKNSNAVEYQNINSVFSGGKSVCAGYAKSLMYILEQMDIPCIVVAGREKGDDQESHLWNLARIEGTDFYLDVTWDDSSISENVPAAARKGYDNLGMNDSLLAIRHETDTGYGNYPVCDSLKYYYYLREGEYFDLCDRDIIEDKVKTDLDAGKSKTTIKFEKKEDYDAFVKGMADSISDLILHDTGLERVKYYKFPDRYRIIYLWK